MGKEKKEESKRYLPAHPRQTGNMTPKMKTTFAILSEKLTEEGIL